MFCIKLINDFPYLPNENLLHLWMQVCFRLLDKNQMHCWGARLGTESTIKTENLKKDEY